MKKFAFLLLALGAFGSTAASARPYHYTPVSWIVSTRDNINVDDRYVTIIGHVTRRIGDDEYWFSDGTGSVRLDSENFDLPIGRRIVIGGRIDQAYLGIGHLEVDVRRWHFAPISHPIVVKTAPVTRPVPVTPAPAPAEVSRPTPPPAETAPAPAVSTTPPPAPVSTPAVTTTPPPEPAAATSTTSSTNQPATTPLTPPAESH